MIPNPWLIVGFIVIALGMAAGGYWRGDEAGQAKVQQPWDKEKAEQLAEYAKAQEAARKKEQDWQAASEQLRKEKDAKIKSITARAAAMVSSVQDRPNRPETGSMPDNTGTCAGATGSQLARPDAEFLAGYAADAAKLQEALNQCVTQYNLIRSNVNGNQNGN